jgi:hypothetical protein
VPELSDDEAAELDQGGEEVGKIEPAAWSAITRARADFAVLRAFELSDAAGWELVELFRARAEAWEASRLAGVDRVQLPRPDWRRRP